ncbi:MAG: tetratricopeptide repeat protein, partial [Shewanella sp.]|nr:tetratricopeptide repeat protein [Shewanella sp.]
MYKQISSLLLVAALTGCASAPALDYQATDANREAMLKDSGNHRQLIALYQQQLLAHEDDAVRVKLAAEHLELSDAESALFVITDVKALHSNVAALKVQAKALYQQGQFAQAQQSVQQALTLTPQDGELHSLSGILFAEQGQYDAALNALIQARRYFFDEVKVKNNLASVYMLKGDYPKALTLLAPLYERMPKDSTLRANLIVALVKSGHHAQAAKLIEQHYEFGSSKAVIAAIEQGGSMLVPATHQAANTHSSGAQVTQVQLSEA